MITWKDRRRVKELEAIILNMTPYFLDMVLELPPMVEEEVDMPTPVEVVVPTWHSEHTQVWVIRMDMLPYGTWKIQHWEGRLHPVEAEEVIHYQILMEMKLHRVQITKPTGGRIAVKPMVDMEGTN